MHQEETTMQAEKASCKETLTNEQMIHRWGSAMSEAILDSTCHTFSIPEIDGFIGYLVANDNCAIVIGDPICAEDKKPLLTQAFHKYCKENNLACIYFIVSEKFAKWAIDNVSKILIQVGEEIVFDPFKDPTEGHKGYRLRNKLNHTKHIGLAVKEYLTNDTELEKSILNVGQNWVKARKGPQIYIGDLNFFKNRTNKRWFYLEDDKRNVIGMALLRGLQAHKGWLLKFLIVNPDAPRGASEQLVISIMETLRKEDCHFVTYGMVPADRLGDTAGLGVIAGTLAKLGFMAAKWIFHLEQRKNYWLQFHPQFEKSYLLFSSPRIGIKELRALSFAMKIDL
ncbi:MAG TPA: DUF2156 domain-containing protein [Parachlamydiaceae bacterium]|nr:DUF2156 domain-containing protein [Parachlamydiaceae bacterium]